MVQPVMGFLPIQSVPHCEDNNKKKRRIFRCLPGLEYDFTVYEGCLYDAQCF